jgi:hypothetical protein
MHIAQNLFQKVVDDTRKAGRELLMFNVDFKTDYGSGTGFILIES